MTKTLYDMNALRLFQCTPQIILDKYDYIERSVCILSAACAAERHAEVAAGLHTATQSVIKVSKDRDDLKLYTQCLSTAVKPKKLSKDEMTSIITRLYNA